MVQVSRGVLGSEDGHKTRRVLKGSEDRGKVLKGNANCGSADKGSEGRRSFQ